MRITVGGNQANYLGDCGTPTVDLLTFKILFNSIISTPGTKFMTIDIEYLYLNTPMLRFDYMRLKLTDLPNNIVQQYNLVSKVTRCGYVYVEIRRGMYGLSKSGLLAQQLLEKRLNGKGYQQSKLTPGFWTHKLRPISFSICVDDFGMKYNGKQHVNHLISVLKENYNIYQDWKVQRYLGLDLCWDYQNRVVHLSMFVYVVNAIKRFHQKYPQKPQDQPYPHIKSSYGAKARYSPDVEDSTLLTPADKKMYKKSPAPSFTTQDPSMRQFSQLMDPSQPNKPIPPKTQ